jgi:signal transduction histidine kinase
MERVLATGADLANPPAAMLAPSRAPEEIARSPQPPPRARRARAARGGAHLLPLAYYALASAALLAAGYAPWRVLVVALAAGAQQLAFRSWRTHTIDRCVNADASDLARNVSRAHVSVLLTTAAAAAVTGGLGSPLLPTLSSAYFASVAVAGDRRPTRALLAATAAAAGLLALLPPAVAGPPLPGPAHALLAVLSVLGAAALLAPADAKARTRRDAFLRARKEMASDALVHVQALEQIGSKVAHELKNPLTGVKALVQLGLRSPAEAPSHARLEVVEREVSRMQEILQNYLSFTRPLQAVKPTRVELGGLVSDALVVLSARADDSGVRLFAHGDATVEADPRRLREALLNLVANAIEATPPGGEVVVEVRPLGDEVELAVRDTGRGMPPETLARIGTPFFTTRDDGTGLGVVLARSVIAQHGGSLRYESEPGKGTRVRVTLPREGTGARDAACAPRR